MNARFAAALTMAMAACGGGPGSELERDAALDAASPGPWSDFGVGATMEPDGTHVRFQVRSVHATRLEVWLYREPFGADAVATAELDRVPDTDVWRARVDVTELAGATVYYGLRAWGPNWPFDPTWSPGSEVGFIADVDEGGHRFNPNKLLIDPYARELSHDPRGPLNTNYDPFRVGDAHRARDSGPVAPKSIVIVDAGEAPRPGPDRRLRDEVIYEVHLRGLTRADPSAPAGCAGTFAAAAARAPYLAELGVTAIELLPLAETNNDANDLVEGTAGDNYWGYSTLAYFAPDRRYACDKTPGGPTRELRAMVDAFHAHDIKVYADVVYNHTAEGGGSSLLSLRGLDNAAYYVLGNDPTRFVDNTGIGANTNTAGEPMRSLVLDSLSYWHRELGFDGFRYDLASVLGNRCTRGCFEFDADDPDGLLQTIVRELPEADHIAEPWGIGTGTYQVGNFPAGWAEWNDGFRDDVRRDQNRLGVAAVTPGRLADRASGSYGRFSERGPGSSINYVVSHDGFTLRDLHNCNDKNNAQPWPYGPSDGGHDDNLSWDHNGIAAAQRQAVRTSLALMLLSSGTPMITGGDERSRRLRCNNNPYNLDSEINWIDWTESDETTSLTRFTRRLLRFRSAHPLFRPENFWQPDQVTWLRADGGVAGGSYMNDANQQFLAWRVLGAPFGDSVRSIVVAYNGDSAGVAFYLPEPTDGFAWYRIADTGAWMEPSDNIDELGSEHRMNQRRYDLGGRSLVLFVER